MPKIFISYRREDSRHVTGRVYDRLVGAFGQSSVFKDVDSLPLGIDFRKALADQVGQCDVLLAVIGDAWLRADGTGATRRIDDEADFVRIEIEAALKRDIHVIPLLVGDSPVPKERQLPKTLAPLAYRNGTTLREDPHFSDDIERLIRALRLIKSPGQPPVVDPSQPGIMSGSPFAERREPAGSTGSGPVEIVTAEAVFTGNPFASSMAGPAASGPHAVASAPMIGSEWWAITRWVVVAIILGIVGAVGFGDPNFVFGKAMALLVTIIPSALAFAAFPDVFRFLWVRTRGGTAAAYHQYRSRAEGQLVFWGVYCLVLLLFFLLGLGLAEPMGLFGSSSHLEHDKSGDTNPHENSPLVTPEWDGPPPPIPGNDTKFPEAFPGSGGFGTPPGQFPPEQTPPSAPPSPSKNIFGLPEPERDIFGLPKTK